MKLWNLQHIYVSIIICIYICYSVFYHLYRLLFSLLSFASYIVLKMFYACENTKYKYKKYYMYICILTLNKVFYKVCNTQKNKYTSIWYINNQRDELYRISHVRLSFCPSICLYIHAPVHIYFKPPKFNHYTI